MKQEMKVGFFVLLALVILLPAILFVGNIKIFKRTSTYFADFKDVEALPPKAAVKISGVEIGKVKKIELIDSHARVQLDIDPAIKLYKNAAARVGTTGLIGTRFIDLQTGTPEFPPLETGAVLPGLGGGGLNRVMDQFSTIFEEDPVHGSASDNLKATLANLKNITQTLNRSVGKREKEIGDIVLNLRDLTADLKEIVSEKKDDVKLAMGKLKDVSVKLDRILTKIEKGEGAIGVLVSDDETGEQVKTAVEDLGDTISQAQEILGRVTSVHTYWNYQFRYDFRDDKARSDVAIKFVPRPGKYYALGATNLGSPVSNERNVEFERKNRIMAVIGQEFHPAITGYAGVIRSDGGLGINIKPFWFQKKWKDRVELMAEASDFQRDRTVKGTRLDSAWTAAGIRVAVQRWLWVGARVEDILERSVFMANINVTFRDEDLSYALGLAGAAR